MDIKAYHLHDKFFFAGSIIWNTGFKEECLLYKKAFGLKKKINYVPCKMWQFSFAVMRSSLSFNFFHKSNGSD